MPDPMKPDLFLPCALALLLAGAACAAAAAPRACSFGAFVEETDPAGLNVRAAPGTAAPVLGTLPPTWVDPADPSLRVRIEVQVTAADEGWFRIRAARDNEAMTGRPARRLFRGEGWVSGRKLVVKSQATRGRERPSADAPVTVRQADDGGFDSDAMVDAGRPVDCQGRWAQVEYTEATLKDSGLRVAPAARAGLPAGRFRTWVDQLCALQETSCDGPGR